MQTKKIYREWDGAVEEKMHSKSQIQKILKEQFGHGSFRGDQEQVILRILDGKSALALMPTGMGKSLCYQLPSALIGGLTVVISPLIALMQDQVDKAKSLGIKATFLASTLTAEERQNRYHSIGRGEFKLILVTPERFRKPEFLEQMAKQKVSLLVVDEAHCISLWGHDFRPDYSKLGEFRAVLGNPVTLALTATATQTVQKDILKNLNIEDAQIFSAGVERANLKLRVHEVVGDDEKIRGIVGLRHEMSGPMIIYFSLISTLQRFSQNLARLGLRHTIYHGQLQGHERTRNQKLFIEGKSDFILATPAFGLGIDKPDVRLLVHAEIPNSIEAYYQEYGRAGRDGKDSECHLFLDQDDVSIQMDFIKWTNPEPVFVRRVYELVEENGPGVQSEGVDFLREKMNFYNRRDFRVESALNILERLECLAKDNSRLGFKALREPSRQDLDQSDYELRMKAQNQKLLEMLQLAKMETGCRTQVIYQYFGFQSEVCGKCDLCLYKN